MGKKERTNRAPKNIETRNLCTIEYSIRSKSLISLNFKTYEDYLFSDLWKNIRIDFLNKNPFCYLCNKLALQIHHASYSLATKEFIKYKKRLRFFSSP
jgi:hypothetical protein